MNVHIPNSNILDNLFTAILILNDDFVVTYANPAAEQLVCLSMRRLCTQPFPKIFPHCQLDLAQIHCTLSRGQSFIESDLPLNFDGHAHTVNLSAHSISWQENPALLLEFQIIDQQKQRSQETQQFQQQQAAKELIRGLAHEIKNPLGGLRGAAQLLQKMLPDPMMHEYTHIIIAQADRLSNLVNRLLGPQKIGQRKIENIHVILEKVRQLIALEAPMIKIIRDYDPSLPEVEMDADQLEQAILNILNNAVHILASQLEQKIQIRTRTEHQVILHGQRHRLAIRIDITDNGPGVDPKLQDTLFYPMISGRAEGTGLGLAITQNLIHQHQGKIFVNSCAGQTTFSILLPVITSYPSYK